MSPNRSKTREQMIEKIRILRMNIEQFLNIEIQYFQAPICFIDFSIQQFLSLIPIRNLCVSLQILDFLFFTSFSATFLFIHKNCAQSLIINYYYSFVKNKRHLSTIQCCIQLNFMHNTLTKAWVQYFWHFINHSITCEFSRPFCASVERTFLCTLYVVHIHEAVIK